MKLSFGAVLVKHQVFSLKTKLLSKNISTETPIRLNAAKNGTYRTDL